MQRSACNSLAFSIALAVALAACGGGGGGGGGGTIPPIDTSGLPATVGLVSAAAGDASAQVRWIATDADGQPVTIAIFSGADHASVYQGAPVHGASGSGSVVLGGLTNGAERFFGLALDLGGAQYEPIGSVLGTRPAPPIYVDASSAAASPDGTSPAKAFRDPLDGVLAAFAAGGGNVWVAEGSYSNVAIPVWPGVHVYGGFDASFSLAARDATANPTRLRGRAGAAICEVLGGDPGAVLDGLALDGLDLAPFGVDIDQTPAEVRGVSIERCAGRGMRLRSLALDRAFDVRIARCDVASNGAEGVSVDGAFDLWVEGSRFAANAFEGFDLDGLVGPDQVPVRLRVRDCTFSGNGQEGLDCDMLPPLVPGTAGSYEIEIAGSTFERNGWAGVTNSTAGLNLDIDFELVAGWQADIVVRGCTARANRGDGIRLDLDSTSSAFLHRLLSVSNGGDGLRVSSESTPSFATVSTSAFVGNAGAGVHATFGNVPVVVSHCVLAGNPLGGVVSDVVESSASSSVAWMQPQAFVGTRAHFDVTATDPLQPPFVHAPVEYRRALSFDGALVTLDDNASLAVGDDVELGDDGIARNVDSVASGERVGLDPLPQSPHLPALFARFDSPGGVDEDYHLAPNSPAGSAGMPGTGGSADAGPFGAPLAGAPGWEEVAAAMLFRAASSTPAVAQSVAANQSIRLRLAGGVLDSLTVTSQNVRVRGASGNVLAATAFVQAGELVIAPPGGGWPSGALTVELHAALQATDGTALSVPVALPYRAP